jgi:HNH endonuclease
MFRPTRPQRSCTFEGCARPHRAKGLCSSHLDQLARGKPLAPIRVWKKRCEFPSCNNKHAGNGLCTSHKSQLQRGHPLRPIGAGFRLAWDDRKGYVHIKAPAGHPNARKDGYMFEHVLVMSQMLGRPLLPGEHVHHRNGVKNDNRPENLELWAGHQPKGQRVEDLVGWAREILACYGDLYPATGREAYDAAVLPSDCRRRQPSASRLPP